MLEKIKSFFIKKIENQSSSVVTTTGYNTGDVVYPQYNRETAMKLYKDWVAVSVGLNSDRVATLPLRLYIRKTPSNRTKTLWTTKPVNTHKRNYLNGMLDNRPSLSVLQKVARFDTGVYEVVDSHPIVSLLSNVNTGFNQYDLVSMRIKYLQLLGNAYLRVIKDESGMPIALQPIPAENMYVETSGSGYEKSIIGYRYGMGGNAIHYAYDEIIHFKRHILSNSIYGIGDMELGWDAIQIDEMEHDYKKAQLKNMGRVDSLITITGADKTRLDRFRTDFNNKYFGPNNAGKAGFVNEEVKVTPLQYTKIDLASYDAANIREIGRVFGVSENKLIGNSSIKANSENQDTEWLRTTITSLATADEQKLNEVLLPMFGEEVAENAFLAYDNPIKEDKDFIVRKNNFYVRGGIITANEARSFEGLDEIEGGDSLRFQGVSMEKLDEPTQQLPAKPDGPGPKESENDIKRYEIIEETVDDTVEIDEVVEDIVEKILLKLEKPEEKKETLPIQINITNASVEEKESDHKNHKVTQLGKFMENKELSSPLIGKWEKDMEVFFKEQSDLVIKNIEGKKYLFPSKKKRGELVGNIEIELDKMTEQLKGITASNMSGIVEVGGKDAYNTLGIDGVFDVSNPEVVKFIDKKSIKLSGAVQKTTVEKIRKTLSEGFENGDSISQLSDRVRESSAFSRERSELIARTESAKSYTGGEIQGWKQSGQVKSTKWLLSPDPCPECEALAAEVNEVPLGENFVDKGGTLNGITYDYEPVNSPPLHPNCRCDLIPILE